MKFNNKLNYNDKYLDSNNKNKNKLLNWSFLNPENWTFDHNPRNKLHREHCEQNIPSPRILRGKLEIFRFRRRLPAVLSDLRQNVVQNFREKIVWRKFCESLSVSEKWLAKKLSPKDQATAVTGRPRVWGKGKGYRDASVQKLKLTKTIKKITCN